MIEKLTPAEAWQDFMAWIKTQPEWAKISRAEKQYLYKTNKAVLNGTARVSWILGQIKKYAPDRYVFHDGEPYFTKG